MTEYSTYYGSDTTTIDRQRYRPIGVYCLYILLVINPFHHYITEQLKLIYYRELCAVVFCMLLLHHFFKGGFRNNVDHHIRQIIVLLLLFNALIIICACFDPGYSIYGEDIAMASIHLASGSIKPEWYIVRNSLIYVPMVLFFSLVGVRKEELTFIAVIIGLVAPVSILAYALYKNIASYQTIGIIISMGGEYVDYNSYVPYLTYAATALLFVILSDSSLYIKIVSAASLGFVAFYICFSTSRQSTFYLMFLISAGLYCYKGMSKVKVISAIVILSVISYGFYEWLGSGYRISDKMFDRYSSSDGLLDSTRYEIMEDGLRRLNFSEFIFGVGLSSVIFSGPHNDYIRWTQRIGVFGMIIGFTPYFIGFLRSLSSKGLKTIDVPVSLFLSSSLGFTLYHSFFGYPREDAYQGLYCFLGLAIWLGFYRNESGLQSTVVGSLQSLRR